MQTNLQNSPAINYGDTAANYKNPCITLAGKGVKLKFVLSVLKLPDYLQVLDRQTWTSTIARVELPLLASATLAHCRRLESRRGLHVFFGRCPANGS